MIQAPGILSYAGADPARRRSVFHRCWRAVVFLVTAALFATFLIVRAALLATGFACVFAGTILLTLGGKRGAARKLLEWRERFVDLVRLWTADILRTLRRRRHDDGPQRVLPVVSVPSR